MAGLSSVGKRRRLNFGGSSSPPISGAEWTTFYRSPKLTVIHAYFRYELQISNLEGYLDPAD